MHVTVGRNTGAGMTILGPADVQVVDRGRPTPARRAPQTTLSSVTTSVAGDASCGFPIVADPGLSGCPRRHRRGVRELQAGRVDDPAGEPRRGRRRPVSVPFDQRFGQRFTGGRRAVRRGRLRAGRVEPGGPPPVPTPTPDAAAGPDSDAPTDAGADARVQPRPSWSRRFSGTVLVCPRRPTQCIAARAGERSRSGRRRHRRAARSSSPRSRSAGGTPEKAKFYDGIFSVTQSGAITDLTLNETLAPARRPGTRGRQEPKTRKLWGDGKGKFRTKGRYAAATVRGTQVARPGLLRGHADPTSRRAP